MTSRLLVPLTLSFPFESVIVGTTPWQSSGSSARVRAADASTAPRTAASVAAPMRFISFLPCARYGVVLTPFRRLDPTSSRDGFGRFRPPPDGRLDEAVEEAAGVGGRLGR